MLGEDVARAPHARVHEGAWLVAFGVLVLNDHALKGAGVLPGAVTGKLSDFAGLFVAPVMLSAACALLGLRGPRVRALCSGAVALVFTAIKLSPVAARALAALLTACGVPSRFWSDPWDLVALVVLPLAWRTAAVVERRLAEPRRWLHRVAVALGAFGCVATSYHLGDHYKTSAYLVNLSDRVATVQVLRATAPLDCGALEAAASVADYAGEFCTSLVAGEVIPLDGDFERALVDTALPEPDPPCDAVVLRSEQLPDTLFYWQTTRNVEIRDQNPVDDTRTRQALVDAKEAVTLEEAGGHVAVTGTSQVRKGSLGRTLPPSTCEALPTFNQYAEAREP